MKKIFSLALMFVMSAFIFIGCGTTGETVTLGVYNPTSKTFTALESDAAYSLDQNCYDLTLKGTIPHSASMLGIKEGNIVAIRFTAPTGTTVGGEEAYVKTTNRQDASANGWNAYGEEAFEKDGSLVWVTSVSKDNPVQIKIKWNASVAEVVYTLKVAADAELQ